MFFKLHDCTTIFKTQQIKKIRLMKNHLPGNCKEAEYGDEKREDAPDGEDQGHDQEVEGDHLIIFRKQFWNLGVPRLKP